MTAYTILNSENLPDSFKDKPKWMICTICTVALIIMIVSAISVGVFIGYTYCYVEHQTGFSTGNITQTTDIQVLQVPFNDNPEEAYKRTINGASQFFISKMMKIGHTLWEDGSKSPTKAKTETQGSI